MNFSPICISINVDLSHCRPQSLSNYPMGLARPFLPSFGFPRDPAHLRTTTLFSCPLFAMHEICSETRLEFMMRTYTSLESLLGNPFRFCTTPTRRGALPAGQRSPRLPHFEYTGTILRSCVYQILITLDTANKHPSGLKKLFYSRQPRVIS